MDNVTFLNIQDEEWPGGECTFETSSYTNNNDHQGNGHNNGANRLMMSTIVEGGEEVLGSPSRSPSLQHPKSTSPRMSGRFQSWLQYDLMTMSARKLALIGVAIIAVSIFLGFTVYSISIAASSVDKNEGVNGTFFAVLQDPPSLLNENEPKLQVLQNTTLSTPTIFTTTIPPTTTTPKPKKIYSEKADFIRSMTASAWNAYKEHSWGHASLKPVTKEADNRLFGPTSGRTIVSAMSTLFIMNMTEEFEAAANWIRDKLDLSQIDKKMNVCDLVTDYIGGLLSCWALTGREIFKEKALEIAKLLEPAYETSTGLPYEHLNPNRSTAFDSSVWLTWAGGQFLEYKYLEFLYPQEKTLSQRLDRMRTALKKAVNPQNGLYPERLFVDTNRVTAERLSASETADFSWASRQFYSALAKSWLLTSGADEEALLTFTEAIEAADQAAMFANYTFEENANQSANYFVYVHDVHIDSVEVYKAKDIFEEEMDFDDIPDDFWLSPKISKKTSFSAFHGSRSVLNENKALNKRRNSFSNIEIEKTETLKRKKFSRVRQVEGWTEIDYMQYMKYHSCYLGGLLALMADDTQVDDTTEISYKRMAKELTRTCFIASNSSKSGLAPYTFYFGGSNNLQATNDLVGLFESSNLLNPELAESYFVLWRKTRDPIYREYAWHMVQAIEANCKTPSGGYSAVTNVNVLPTEKENSQSPYLFGTFKYLYLIFADDDKVDGDELLSLDFWVFNTVGHPLPVFDPTKKEVSKKKKFWNRMRPTTTRKPVVKPGKGRWA